jgi:diamine N-acetyltransferase
MAMEAELKNKATVHLQQLDNGNYEQLLQYFAALSDETRARFGPHPFNIDTLKYLFENEKEYYGYIATEPITNKVTAYAVVKKGFLQHESERLQRYGLILNNDTDAVYAPSVADAWQGLGLGTRLFRYIENDLQARGIKRVILWGGVQSSNFKALNYYINLGFTLLGQFEYNGNNKDMSYTFAKNKI